MKNTTTKKASAKKKLLPAAGSLLISAAMLSTSTYAWFTMNKEVSVTGMKLKATAEQGLVISDYTKTDWKKDWTVTMTDAAVLAPTSTDGAASPSWVYAASSKLDDAEKNDPQALGYQDYTPTWSNDPTTGEGIGSASRTITVGDEAASQTIPTNYVLLRKFYIKGTGDTAWAQNLVIDKVEASVSGGGAAASANLDKSLRVLVVVGSNSFIYAPIEGYDNACKFKGTGSNLTLVPSTSDSVCTSITSIPAATTDAPIEVSMYMYFEGEDTNCKSSNASGISVDTLEISANFKTQDVAGG